MHLVLRVSVERKEGFHASKDSRLLSGHLDSHPPVKWLQLLHYKGSYTKRSMSCVYVCNFCLSFKQLTDEEGIVNDITICLDWSVPIH